MEAYRNALVVHCFNLSGTSSMNQQGWDSCGSSQEKNSLLSRSERMKWYWMSMCFVLTWNAKFFVKYITLIITKKKCTILSLEPHLTKKELRSNHLLTCIYRYHIFCFCSGKGHNLLQPQDPTTPLLKVYSHTLLIFLSLISFHYFIYITVHNICLHNWMSSLSYHKTCVVPLR